jgi:hypothetical protein
VHEVVTVDEKFSRLIIDKAPSGVLRRASIEAGMIPIREDALNKIRAGLTSAEDVMRQVYLKAEDDEDKNWQSPSQLAQISGSSIAALPAVG